MDQKAIALAENFRKLGLGAQQPAERRGRVVVAVLDSGIDASGYDWDSKLVGGKSLFGGKLCDSLGHGSAMARIIADIASGGDPACPAVQIMPVQILHPAFRTDGRIIADGIRYAADSGATVIIFPLNITRRPRTLPRRFATPGSGERSPSRRAAGTSVSAAQASGAAALLRSLRPELTAEQTKELLCQHTRKPPAGCWNPQAGYGLLHLGPLVERIQRLDWSRLSLHALTTHLLSYREPCKPLTRNEFVELLLQGLGLGRRPELNGFADIAADDRFAGAAGALHRLGWAVGARERRFRPDCLVTNDEIHAMMNIALTNFDNNPCDRTFGGPVPQAPGGSLLHALRWLPAP